MKSLTVILLFLIILVVQLPENVKADTEPACALREDIIRSFEVEFGEKPQAAGIGPFGLIIEVLAAPTGTFTILATRPDGISCIVAAGAEWRWIKGEGAVGSI